ncbi:pectinesterase [Synchytrium microbalum]|uniref:pectinesterase n=1 Tax=Synchytrium microbalum TaxID=1806994 RepID=A0A507CAK8_9FUNG|nr:pectinesterase [Synchytrium microbalum]TPX36209.1 pectinesterase [Synchytrium microbalum]
MVQHVIVQSVLLLAPVCHALAVTVTVDWRGNGAMFKTIQEAVNSLSLTSTEAQVLTIAPGKYLEQVTIPFLQGQLNVYGLKTPSLNYTDNQVTISCNKNRATESDNFHTATLRILTSKVKIYNINVENTSPPSAHQALALAASVGMQGYYACQFSAYQDTVWTDSGHQVFSKCMISGLVDFIFGGGRALVTKTFVRVLPGSVGYITASGRKAANSSAWILLDQCHIDGGDSGTTHKIFLGRPWRPFGKVIVQHSYLSDIINPRGWAPWMSTMSTANAEFQEFGNTGPGAPLGNRTIGHQANTSATISDILGADYLAMSYVDGTFL